MERAGNSIGSRMPVPPVENLVRQDLVEDRHRTFAPQRQTLVVNRHSITARFSLPTPAPSRCERFSPSAGADCGADGTQMARPCSRKAHPSRA